MMMLIIVGGGGNKCINGINFINYYLPSVISMGIIPLAFINFPIWIGKKIEDGSMERMNYFGIKTRNIILIDILSHIIFGLVGIAVDMVFALAVFNLHFPGLGYFIAFVAQIFYAFITFLVWGGVFALAFKNMQVLMSVGLVVMFFLYFCGGIFFSLKNFPGTIQCIAKIFPAHYLPTAFVDIWLGQQYWCGKFLWISAIWLAAGAGLLFAMTLSKLRSSKAKQN